jgi:hypothetical protein
MVQAYDLGMVYDNIQIAQSVNDSEKLNELLIQAKEILQVESNVTIL